MRQQATAEEMTDDQRDVNVIYSKKRRIWQDAINEKIVEAYFQSYQIIALG